MAERSVLPWALTPSGLRILVRVTPKRASDTIEGVGALADGRAVLKLRVRAVPEDGRANAAAVKLIAKALGLAPSAVSIVAGATARLKTPSVAGAGAAEVKALRGLL